MAEKQLPRFEDGKWITFETERLAHGNGLTPKRGVAKLEPYTIIRHLPNGKRILETGWK